MENELTDEQNSLRLSVGLFDLTFDALYHWLAVAGQLGRN